jgi:uncharacterized membrane protein
MPTFLTIPSIPSWNALHPLIVHFPVALLLSVPLFLLLGIIWGKNRSCFFLVSFFLMLLGTISVYVAIETGEAAGKLVERSAEISTVLNHHSQMAHTSQIVFTILTLVYAALLFLPGLVKKELKPLLKQWLMAAFLVIYLVCTLMIANTASLGGRLVHQLGVHALL